MLGRLWRAPIKDALNIPDGLAVALDAYIAWRVGAALGDEIATAVIAQTAALVAAALADHVGDDAARGPWMVRSSSVAEDQAGRAAPGIFASRRATLEELADAIREVWLSATSAGAVRYGVADAPMGLLVQRHIKGPSATVYLLPSYQAVIQWRNGGDDVDGKDDRGDGGISGGETYPALWTAAQAPAVALPALRIAHLAQAHLRLRGGADLEFAIDDVALTIAASTAGHDTPVLPEFTTHLVQARPLGAKHFMPAVIKQPPDAALFAFSANSHEVWRLDVEHNPAPLSVAQAELVAMIAAEPWAPAMRVVGHYLYYVERSDADAALARDDAPIDAETLRATLRAAEADIRNVLQPGPADAALALDDALDRYRDFYRLWYTRVVPVLRAAKSAVRQERGVVPPLGWGAAPALASVPARPNAPAAIVRRLRDGELSHDQARHALRNVTATWDVAAPPLTLAATTALLAPPRLPAALPLAATPTGPSSAADQPRSLAAELAYWEEEDDLWFYDAQAMVRRALLAIGTARGLGNDQTRGEDGTFGANLVMWVPWAILRDPNPTRPLTAADFEAARARTRAAQHIAMPHRFSRGAPLPQEASPSPSGWYQGTAIALAHDETAAERLGRVINLTEVDAIGGGLWGTPPPDCQGAVVVCANLTPGMALLVKDALAIVAATGGPLDHGAAIARELGIFAIVGCAGCDALPSGAIVRLTADGRVARLG